MWDAISFALGAVCSALVLPIVYSVVKALLGIGPSGKTYSAAPIQEVIEIGGGEYNQLENKAPKLTGKFLVWFSRFLWTPLGGKCMLNRIMKDNRVFEARERYIPEAATFYPTPPFVPFPEQTSGEGGGGGGGEGREIEMLLNSPVTSSSHESGEGGGEEFVFPSVMDYLRGYRSGGVTPEVVGERIIESISASESLSPPLRAFVQWNESEIRKQAAESTRRYKEKDNIRPLEGVPVAVKEEFLASNYRLLNGLSFLPVCAQNLDRQREESEPVVRLKKAGVILIGVTNMHEAGIGSSGSNPNWLHGTARNPYDLDRYCGGSSSGSGAAVASGLVPLALGTDGGGSVRIPSSLCGIVGLKPTFGRLSSSRTCPVGMTIVSSGPMCTSVEDTALSYLLLSGVDPEHQIGIQQGPVTIDRYLNAGDKLSGMRVGVYNKWFDHSDRDVRMGCRVAVTCLQETGAEIVDIRIPEINQSQDALTVIILSEIYAGYRYDLPQHFKDMTSESLIAFAMGTQFSAADYIVANRQRTRAIKVFQHLFKQVDVIASPSTAGTAPIIRPQAVNRGESDLESALKLVRYTMLANLTGMPAISIPVAYDSNGLPVSFQLMAAWWQENLLFQVASAIEKRVKKQKPKVFYDILGKSD